MIPRLRSTLIVFFCKEVFNAPKRRVDNEVSRLADATNLLEMHCKIISETQRQYRRHLLQQFVLISTQGILSVGIPAGFITLGISLDLSAAVGVLGLSTTAATFWYQQFSREAFISSLASESRLEEIYSRLYAKKIAEKDEFTQSLWLRVKHSFRIALTAAEFRLIPKITSSDVAKIENVLNNDIPSLRRKAGPAYHGSRG
jgi:hypothetical protein